MGYHVKYEELQSVQQSILNQIDNWYNQLEEVAKKLVDVAEMDHIKGATGESIKNYIYEVHIPIIQMFTQLLAEYETKFLIYANEYYELDSSTSAEIAQDELEDQIERLNEKKEMFNESDESLRKTLEGISDIISLRAPSAYGVRSNYTGLYNKAEDLRDKVGEHEETHFSSAFEIMDEMLSKLSGLIDNQIGKADFSITNYEVGAITKLSNYETLSELFAKQQDYLNNSIEERAKAMEGYNIRQQIIAEETYAKERIAEGGLQTVGGIVSVVAGLGLIVATGGLATPIAFGAFAVGTCSTLYGISNTEEGLDNIYYGIKGDGKSIAVNPIRDTHFQSNPELYYKIGNASTIISSLGAPMASGVPIEKVMATQTKRMVSGTVGSVASNAIMERYDLNPYIAMGIGMGISKLTYMGIDSMEVDTTMGITASGGKGVKSTTSNKKDIQSYTYNMVENPGPLAEIDGQPAKNFFGGKYNLEVLDEDRIYYRAGEKGSPLGQWFTSEPAESIAKVRIETAVKPQWIDPATGKLTGTSTIDTNYAIKIPAGTTVYMGPVGYQGGIYLGGYDVMQIFIEKPWKLNVKVINQTPLK